MRLFFRLTLGVILVAVLTFSVQKFSSSDSLNDDYLKIEQHNIDQKMIQAKIKLKKRADGAVGKRAKPDQPDMFAAFHKSIRTREGENEPTYPLNYRRTEMIKARANANALDVVLPWQGRGPGNVGGRTRAVIIDPDDPSFNTWICGSVGGGVWKTTDAGNTWQNKSPNMPNLATTVLGMAASNHDIIYLGTGEGFFNIDAIAGDGMWKSTDRGETWTQLASTAANSDFKYVNRLVIDPADANIVVVATNTGIFRTTDGGTNWTQTYNNGRIQHVIANPDNFNTQFATLNGSGILASKDGGSSWTFVKSLNGGRIELAMAPSDTSRIYAALQTSDSRLYMSQDAGVSWVQVVDPSGNGNTWLGSQGWYDNTIAVDPYNPDVVFVGGINLWRLNITPPNQRTSTRITNWYPGTSRPFVHADQHNIAIVKTNPAANAFRMVVGNDGGVEYSNDGGNSWNKTLNGYNTTQFYGADKAPGFNAYVGGMQDNGTWVSPQDPTITTPWINARGGDGFDVSWHSQDPLKFIGSVQFNAFFRTLNGGASGESATNGMTDVGSGAGIFISALGKSRLDPDLLFAVGASGIWRTDDFADQWHLVASPGFWGFNGTSGQAKISKANPQVVWGGNGFTASQRVNVSQDGGLSFSTANYYQQASLGRITGMDTHPRDEGTAYLTFSINSAPKVLRTTDYGQNWEDISGFGSGSSSTNGFPNVATYCVLVMPHTPDTLWAGTEIGLFESTDNGASWHYANNGLPAVSIWDMDVVDDQIVVATHGRGVWSVTIPELLNAPTPQFALAPRVRPLTQTPQNNINIEINLRSVYDSTWVVINGQNFAKVLNSTPKDTMIMFPVSGNGNLEVQAVSYKYGNQYKSYKRIGTFVPYYAPQSIYVNDFNTPSDDFFGNGFSITGPFGFNDPAIHTVHPYSNNSDLYYYLKQPIVVADNNAIIEYDEIAIVEPGDPGSVFGQQNFWDYVVVEGSQDGAVWEPIEDGYDARLHNDWLNTYNNGQNGNPALFKTNQIDLLSKYNANDNILIRFHLYADGAVTGWGWAIDNLKIQENAVGIEHSAIQPMNYELSANYPNPFNPSTTIRYQIPTAEKVEINIYNSLGQLVKQLVNGFENAGQKQVVWQGKDKNGQPAASGIYYYQIKAGDFTKTQKMMLLK